MSWWQILLLLLGVGGGAALLTWLLSRKREAPLDPKELVAVERTRLQLEVQAEKARRKKVEQVNEAMKSKLLEHKERLKQRMQEVDDETAKEYDSLRSDVGALLDRVDGILTGARGRG